MRRSTPADGDDREGETDKHRHMQREHCEERSGREGGRRRVHESPSGCPQASRALHSPPRMLAETWEAILPSSRSPLPTRANSHLAKCCDEPVQILSRPHADPEGASKPRTEKAELLAGIEDKRRLAEFPYA